MLHGVAVIPTGVTFERHFDRIDKDLGCLVTVAMTVHRDAGLVQRGDDVCDLIGRHQPQTVLIRAFWWVVVVRPGDPCRETLD